MSWLNLQNPFKTLIINLIKPMEDTSFQMTTW